MNFTDAGSFDFVTGDLSDITIDNDIMPVRSGDAANHIRGMDIAFIKEAIEERRRAVEKSPMTPSFSKSITAEQINGIGAQLLDMFYDEDDDCEWLDDFPSTSVNGYREFTPSTYGDIPVSMSDWDFGVNRVQKPTAADSISTDDDLLVSQISSMFSKVGACKIFTKPINPIFNDAPYSLTELPYYYPGVSDPNSSARDYVNSAMTGSKALYVRYAVGHYVGRTYYGCEGERGASDLPEMSFPNSYSSSAKIYAVIHAYDYLDSNSIVMKCYMKYINDGTTLDRNALMSVKNAIKSGLTIYETSELPDIAASHGGGVGQTVAIYLRRLFCVYNLRDRTRWS